MGLMSSVITISCMIYLLISCIALFMGKSIRYSSINGGFNKGIMDS